MTKTIELSAGVITRLCTEFAMIKASNAAMAFPVLRAINTTLGDNQKVMQAIDDSVNEVRSRHVEKDEEGRFKTTKPSIIMAPVKEDAQKPPEREEYVFITSKEEYKKELTEVNEKLYKLKVTRIPLAATNNLMLDTRHSNFQVFNSVMIHE